MPLLALIAALALRIVNIATLAAAATDDVKRRRVPDILSLIVLGAGVSLRLLDDPRAFWASLLAGGLVYVALAALVHAAVIGGSDAKLTAAATFLVAPTHVPALLIDIALAGGVLSIAYVAARHLGLPMRAGLPYVVAILGGSTYRVIADLYSCSNAISC